MKIKPLAAALAAVGGVFRRAGCARRTASHLSAGQPNKEIARGLGISEGTVKIHLAAIFRALQARNRTEAVIAARALGGVEHLKENQRLAQV